METPGPPVNRVDDGGQGGLFVGEGGGEGPGFVSVGKMEDQTVAAADGLLPAVLKDQEKH